MRAGGQQEKNVTFRCWGLTGEHATIEGSNPQDNTAMGTVKGPIASLDSIMRALGHEGRDLQILKVDCEGCEWTALDYIARAHPEVSGRACVYERSLRVCACVCERSVQGSCVLVFGQERGALACGM